jgi:hypothetical protein
MREISGNNEISYDSNLNLDDNENESQIE